MGCCMIVVSEKQKAKDQINRLDEQINDMSKQEMKELLLINTYKLALIRSQVEALSEVLIKNRLTTYEDLWKKTDTSFKNTTV